MQFPYFFRPKVKRLLYAQHNLKSINHRNHAPPRINSKRKAALPNKSYAKLYKVPYGESNTNKHDKPMLWRWFKKHCIKNQSQSAMMDDKSRFLKIYWKKLVFWDIYPVTIHHYHWQNMWIFGMIRCDIISLWKMQGMTSLTSLSNATHWLKRNGLASVNGTDSVGLQWNKWLIWLNGCTTPCS